MAWVFNENRLGQSRVGDIDDEATVALGTRIKAEHPTYGVGEFIYLAGVASTAVGNAVVYSALDHSTTRVQANGIGPVAFATAATVAAKYGWYQIYGTTINTVAASFADNAAVYLTATAGVLDDAVVAGDRVKGARGASAIDTPATGQALLEIQYPFVDDIAD